jgi:hypothetical protein
MDSSTIQFLFSAVFVLIGSLAFHISALVSGHDIYRDLPTLESTLLSIVAGIVIFWDQFLLGHDIHFQMIRNKY